MESIDEPRLNLTNRRNILKSSAKYSEIRYLEVQSLHQIENTHHLDLAIIVIIRENQGGRLGRQKSSLSVKLGCGQNGRQTALRQLGHTPMKRAKGMQRKAAQSCC